LDAAATAEYKCDDDIIVDTIANAMKKYWQNPSSLYASDVKEEINKCRTNIAKFIGAEANEIIFTSGASESNNMSIRGWVDEIWINKYKTPYVITTRAEHKSIIELLENSDLDAVVGYCNVDEYGFVDCVSLEQMLIMRKGKPVLVGIHMANNEIGTIQPIKQISELVHRYGGVLHIDATQTFGRIPIDVDELGIDMMSVSGHKISPVLKGVGFLYKRNGIDIQPLIYGNQENGLRGGTENTFGIIGLNEALKLCDIGHKKIQELCEKRNYFIELLERNFDCELNGDSYYRLPNNINVTFPQNITGESLLYTLDMSDIKISTASACNSQSIVPSHVLKEIGLSNEEAMRTIRLTMPSDITYEDIDYVVEEIDKAIKIIEV